MTYFCISHHFHKYVDYSVYAAVRNSNNALDPDLFKEFQTNFEVK